MLYPKIGIRPVIDGRWGGVRESLENQTMRMAENAAKLISENLKYPDGTPVQCVIGCTTIGGGAEAARVAEQFSTQNVTATLSVTPCWCYGTETFDMDPNTIKAVWGFNGTERPGAVYLAAVLAAHAQRGLPAFSIYGHDVQEANDDTIPDDVAEKILRFARGAVAAGWMKNKAYVNIGAVTMGIAGSFCDAGVLQKYFGIRAEWVDEVEILRRISIGIYDHDEYEKALAWVRENCKEGFDKNLGKNLPPVITKSKIVPADKDWEFIVKMTLIIRDLSLIHISNPDETQQCYIMTPFYTAEDSALTIPLMTGISRELMKVNDHDDIARWWEIIDRTTGEPLDAAAWHYDAATESVVIDAPAAYHEYTVSFLAYLIWDPVHMYNSVINDWKDVEHQIPFDVRQPKTHAYTMRRLREYLESHPYVNVVRFTTFFHLFTLVFDELRREKYVDWYGYSASVSPYILEQFEKEIGYKFRPEFIIDQGYYNNQYRVPTKEYKDFQAFQRREVAGLMKEMTDIVHAYGKEAMMFLGDHWIGCEPFMPEFQQSGVDAIVGSVGNGSTLRLISDIPGVKYTEGRFLPYFFPDTFHEGGDPVREAKENWVTARRAILRKPIDRIGYGGYLKLACEFPEFLDYVESVCNEFRELYENIKGTTPYCVKTVAVLNSWGQQRAWGCHMVHHALYQKQNYSYAGVIEALSGAPFDVKFISFDDIKADPKVLDGIDVLINVGDGDTAHTGGKVWEDPDISAAVKGFVHRGGGLIGVGEPGGHQYQGRYLQLSAPLGVEKETGFTLNYDKYNWDEHRDHFILADCPDHDVDFGEGKKSIFALEGTEILIQRDKEVQMAAHEYGKGRGVYISGLPYSFVNNRVLYRAILWAAHDEADLHKWFSTNYNVEVHAYVKNGKYCVVNNTYEPQDTTVYTGDGSCFDLHLDTNEIKWYSIEG